MNGLRGAGFDRSAPAFFAWLGVTMYLGDGQMLEAPYTGSVVKDSPVRTSGMTPYVTRMIEW